MPISSASPAVVSAEVQQSEPVVSDAVLMSRFLNRKEEAAFAEIVKRYGEMVFATAVRVLRDRHAAEDVLQATFLVLARDGRKVKNQSALAAWLHGVALRTAKKALLRRKLCRPWEVFMEPVVEDPLLDEMHEVFEQQLLDEELDKLPENYRLPLVLHFLQGKTYEETAEALGTTVGAIEGRMKRGKRELQLRLTRRGVEMTAVMAAIAWSQTAAQAAVQPEIMSTVVQGGMAMLQGSSFAPACSSEAVHLAAKETAMFTAGKIAAATIGLAVASTVGWVGHAGMAQGVGAGVPGAVQPGEIADLTLAQAGEQPAATIGATSTLRGGGGDGQPGAAGAVPGANAGSGLAGGYPGITVPGTAAGGYGDEASGGAGYPDPGAEMMGMGMGMYGSGYGESGPGKIVVSRNRKPTEDKIEQELAKLTNIQFPGNGLGESLQFIGTYHKIPIRIDAQVLEEAGVAVDTEVRLMVEGVSVESGLNMLLENIGGVELTYVIRNETLLITTAEKADTMLETRVYDVRALNQKEPSMLISAIESGTSAGWLTNGDGEGAITALSGQLVIRQTQKGHKEIEDLLNNLYKNLSTGGKVPEWTTPSQLPGQQGGRMYGGGGLGGGGGAGVF